MSDYVRVIKDGYTFDCYGDYTPSTEAVYDSQGLLDEEAQEGDFACDHFVMFSNRNIAIDSFDLPENFISSAFWEALDERCYDKLEGLRCESDN